jgi:hypothetical protein
MPLPIPPQPDQRRPFGGPAYIGKIFAIPVGQGGLVGIVDQAAISPDKLIQATSVSYFGLALQKEGGAVKYNTTAITGAPTLLGGWDWWTDGVTQRAVVFASDGKMYKDSGAGTFPVTLASGLTTGNVVPVFVEGGAEAQGRNRKLFCFTGLNAVQVLSGDGATTTALATPPADWTGAIQPTFGLMHEGRMFGGGNSNDPHRLYFSDPANHELFTGVNAGTLAIYPGEGEKLVGAVSFKGLIIVFKFPVGIYLVDTSSPTVANWRVSRLTRAIGGVSPLGAVVIENDVLFMDPSVNIHSLSRVNAADQAGSISESNLTRVDHIYGFLQNNVNTARLPFVRAVFYSQKREVHFAIAGSGSVVNNARFVVDFNLRQPLDPGYLTLNVPRFRWSDRDTCESIWLRKDANGVPRLTSGDNKGFVWNMDQATKSKDGLGYKGNFQTPYMDFGWIDPVLGTVRKIGQYLELEVNPTGNWNLSVDILWDGTYTQTVNFNMGTTGAAIGSFTLGTDKLAGDQILNRKKRILGSGRRLSLNCYNSGAAEDFSVGKFFLHCLVSDERPARGT